MDDQFVQLVFDDDPLEESLVHHSLPEQTREDMEARVSDGGREGVREWDSEGGGETGSRTVIELVIEQVSV